MSVIIALCGLVVVGIPFLTVMGFAAAGTVLVALLIALTLLPAALGFAGKRAARFSRIPGLRRVRKATVTSVTEPTKLTGTRYAAWVVRHRFPVLIVGVLMLGALALPALHMDLGIPGASSEPTSQTDRRAYDLTTAHFGPGYNGALTILDRERHQPDSGPAGRRGPRPSAWRGRLHRLDRHRRHRTDLRRAHHRTQRPRRRPTWSTTSAPTARSSRLAPVRRSWSVA